ncbi:MAG: UDP-2,3-diacylglucosamine diphosphatase [SAR324 cluster bacterium]|nr:UDP-2,3-diacylglucosamine diphosphatase [SAR324 cluster bacterium]
MKPWMPDWGAMLAEAPEFSVGGADGYVYLIADAHLGDARAAPEPFLAMLGQLPEARAIVFLGDLFKVWLALPKYWNSDVRAVIEGFRRLREAGSEIVFVVGNREYFLPKNPDTAARRGLPFDRIIHEAAVMEWAGRRLGLTHGDLVNREDSQYLKWRRFSRGWPMEAAFRALPGAVARRIASRLERSLANPNQESKLSYPLHGLQAFAGEAMQGLDGYFIGHFHRDEEIRPAGSVAEDGGAVLRILPDWFSTRRVLRLDEKGGMETLEFS